MTPEEQIRNSGKSLRTINAWGRSFILVKETDWSILYKHEEYILNISKAQAGILDPRLLDNSPDELHLEEVADAAVSLYGFGDGSSYLPFKIPATWIRFAETFCEGR